MTIKVLLASLTFCALTSIGVQAQNSLKPAPKAKPATTKMAPVKKGVNASVTKNAKPSNIEKIKKEPLKPLNLTKKTGKLEDGSVYELLTNDNVPKLGDFIAAHILVKLDDDSILANTRDPKGQSKGNPAELPIQAHQYAGDLMDVLPLISEGGSAKITISTDSVYKANPTQKPAFMKPGSHLIYEIEVLKIIPKADYEKVAMERQKMALAQESSSMEKYLTGNNLKAEKTPSGMYVAITKPGSGPKPTKGQKVTVHYTGRLLNGTKFDSSVDRGTPFDFTLGQGEVIKGWDEGIALLNKGAKATLVIPSTMGYGERGAGANIPPNSVLVFDVELVDFK